MITGAETAHLTPKIPTIYLDGKLPLVVERTAADLGLKDGQVIQATVESRPERIRLNLQDSAFVGKHIDLPKELPAGLRLAAGDTALFRVQLQSDGSILLRPLQAQAAPTLGQPLASAQLPNRLQQLLFRPPMARSLTSPPSISTMTSCSHGTAPPRAAASPTPTPSRPIAKA